MAFETGYSSTLAAELTAAGSSMEVATAPTITAGVLKIGTGTSAEWIQYDGVSGTTITITKRQLSKTAGTKTAGTGVRHGAGEPVKFVAHGTDLIDKDGMTDIQGNLGWSATTVEGLLANSLTTTERDALSSPTNGAVIYNETTGQMQFREGGAWNANAAGSSVANASTTVAGKVEIATAAEFLAGTGTGGTGALLVPANDDPLLNESAVFFNATDITGAEAEFLTDAYVVTGTAGETLAAGDFVYHKQSDDKLWKADADAAESTFAFVGVITTGGAADATVTYKATGVVTGLSSLTPGVEYYISATAGAITTTVGTFKYKVGRALTATTFLIERGIKVSSGSGSASATGDIAITAGFKPSFIHMFGSTGTLPFSPGSDGDGAISWGVATGAADEVSFGHDYSEAVELINNNTSAILFVDNATDNQSWTVVVKQMDVLGFTLTATKEGAIGNLAYYWKAIG